MKKSREDLIIRCRADKFLPPALVLGLYIILHGHLSPGGGFQGGVVVAGSILLLYLGHGRRGLLPQRMKGMHIMETLGSIAYVVLAVFGILLVGSFCGNFLAESGTIGEIWSSGTIFLMNFTVGLKVLAGISFLLLLMFGLLASDEEEEGKDVTGEGGEQL